MNIKTTFDTDGKLSGCRKPRSTTQVAQSIILLDATARNAWADASLAQMVTTARKVVTLVDMEFVETGSRSTCRRRIASIVSSKTIVPVCTGDGNYQGKASSVYEEMPFAAKFTSVRVGARALAPVGWALSHHQYSPESNQSGRAHADGSEALGAAAPTSRRPIAQTPPAGHATAPFHHYGLMMRISSRRFAIGSAEP